jgi:hypothetical protein
MLARQQEKKGVLAFLSARGTPLLRTTDNNHRVDLIAEQFALLRKALASVQSDLARSFKHFRKTSATLLNSHRLYRGLVQHFLGQTPDSIAKRHYAAEDQQLFDEAVDWLGKQLCLVTE